MAFFHFILGCLLLIFWALSVINRNLADACLCACLFAFEELFLGFFVIAISALQEEADEVRFTSAQAFLQAAESPPFSFAKARTRFNLSL